MPLSDSHSRQAIHSRSITSQGFLRADGLWDIDTQLVDTKAQDYLALERDSIKAGTPIHDISLRLTVDNQLTVQDIEVSTDQGPFDVCPETNDAYKRLIGQRIESGWRQLIKTTFVGFKGCTHVNDLLLVAATTAYQTVYPHLHQQQLEQVGQDQAWRHVAGVMYGSCHAFGPHSKMMQGHFPEVIAQNIKVKEIE
jgi:hypothetical protein